MPAETPEKKEPSHAAARTLAAAGWLTEITSQWGPFVLGLSLGVTLAFLIYAGLQPRLEIAVRNQKALEKEAKAKETIKDSAAAVTARLMKLKLDSLSGPVKKKPKKSVAAKATTAQPNPGLAPDTGSIRLTQLAPTIKPEDGSNYKTWAFLVAVLLMIAAIVIGRWVWRQYQQEPQPTGTITSPVLEALFTLPTHRALLQKGLSLSPRQIKRFSNKARVQHSQLRALAQPSKDRPSALPFPVDRQIKAFQLLLLLEADRSQLAPHFPPNNSTEFIRRLQAAYANHEALATARQEAVDNPKIKKTKDQEGVSGTHQPDTERQFMQQLYEMNAGLLA